MYRKESSLDTARTNPDTSAVDRQRPPARPSWSRRFYIGFAALFALGVVAQVFLAGAGLFIDRSWLDIHSALGHLLTSPLPLFPLLMLILSFTARLPRSDRWLAALLLVLATVQPVMLYMRGRLPWFSVLHPVNALLLFMLPLVLLYRARRVSTG
jgi:hypothetical protein